LYDEYVEKFTKKVAAIQAIDEPQDEPEWRLPKAGEVRERNFLTEVPENQVMPPVD